MATELNDIKTSLQGLVPYLSRTARECLEAMLNDFAYQVGEWRIVERLSADFDHVVSMGNASDSFQAIVVVGMNRNMKRSFLGPIASTEKIGDIIGEIANTFSGMIMDSDEFTGVFGYLSPSVPTYSKSRIFMPRATGAEGAIIRGDASMSFGFAIRPTNATIVPQRKIMT